MSSQLQGFGLIDDAIADGLGGLLFFDMLSLG
jgi:hypothetical protein